MAPHGMQHVTAFSAPQTISAASAAARKPQLWILSSWRDLIFYVCTPLLIIPIFLVAQTRFSAQNIYLFVAAFGAMGHHLPGMIRAYGDRTLFRRFKWRFILAPAFLILVCATFFFWDLKGIQLVAFIWGVWHGLMQTYGFCRIYDAKVGSFRALTRRLDFATCAVWFAAAVLLSPQRLTDTLDTYYSSGAPFIGSGLLHGAQQFIWFAAILVAALFLSNYAWMCLRGSRPNPVKLVLLATSIGFWWYCNNIVASILVGVALFEVFHDVQYLSLVWIYNRKRVETDDSIGGFMRFVFRRSGSLVGLYIGLIFAYGALGYYKSTVDIEGVKRILTGIVTASALLHFYYDGFIWKVREKSTRQSLGINGGTADISLNGFLPGWAIHGAKWIAAFVIPLGAMWFWQTRSPRSEVDRLALIVANLPASARAYVNYGNALQTAGRVDEASEQFVKAMQINPQSAKTHASLAAIKVGKGELNAARSQFEEALRIDPNEAEYHSGYAYVLEQLGFVDEAQHECERAVQLAPNDYLAWYGYGQFLEKHGKPDQAITHYRHALQLDPKSLDVQLDLATALMSRGEFDEAKSHLVIAIQLNGKLSQPHNYLGEVLMQEGKTTEAIPQFEEALRLHPEFPEAEQNLAHAKRGD